VTQGDPFEPVKIGVLVDMDLGQLLADWFDPTILAIEDALNEGVYDRPVQLVVADARGRPPRALPQVPPGVRMAVRRGDRGHLPPTRGPKGRRAGTAAISSARMARTPTTTP